MGNIQIKEEAHQNLREEVKPDPDLTIKTVVTALVKAYNQNEITNQTIEKYR